MNFRKRFPSLKQVMPVYSVAVVIIYGWAVLRFFWRLPSLLNYSSLGEISSIFAYLITINFLESLTVVFIPIVLSLLLPERWFFDRFVTKGVLLVSLGLGYMLYVASHINTDEPFPYTLFRWMPFVFIVIFAFVFLLDRIAFLTRILENVADRFIVFLFISIPLNIISFILVLFRNIF